MKNIAIVTDTNNVSIEKANELGIYTISMPFIIDQKEYIEGVTLNSEEFFAFLEKDADVTTSQPSISEISELWNKLLLEYDEILHIPMSSSLSGSFETASLMATYEEFDGKVFVVDNKRISVQQIHAVTDAQKLMEEGLSAKEIKSYLEETSKESSVYITLDTLKYLKKGGRITPAAAAIGTLLRIKPVLQIQSEKLDEFSKARTLKQAISIMIKAINNDIHTKFPDVPKEQLCVDIAYTRGQDMVEQLHEIVKEEFVGYSDINIVELPLSISTHIGPGALALALTKRMK
ncbi:MAG: DegV family protein [Tissierellia bacterium]|nr:DegV family protein [Tissierellia bacterium]